MALITGDITCTTGLSKAIHDAIIASATGPDLETKQKAFAFAIASAIITEITTNAVVIPSMVAPPGGGPVTGTGTIT